MFTKTKMVSTAIQVLLDNIPNKLKNIPKTINFWKVISKMPDDVFSSNFRTKIRTFKASYLVVVLVKWLQIIYF